MPDADKFARDAWLRALQAVAPLRDNPTLTLPLVIERIADAAPDRPALIGEDETLTYAALAQRIHGYAGWALRQGIGRGDTVCLMRRNCPDYLALWLGITRVGGTVALLNTNLAGDALAHAIGLVAPRQMIFGDDLPPPPAADTPLPEHPLPTLSDTALYIYTSGTTGLPKAARVSHLRILQWSRWFGGLMDAGPDDRMYNCLPLYHSVGGVVATGAMLVAGGSVVIRERFSASRFWDDVAAEGCTVFQYIGELCRYLVNSPKQPRETAHRLRLACGNGLRPDVWTAFRDRFNIPRILEFYAATEANFSLFNCEGEPGSIGRIPPFLAHRFPVALVRFDDETGEPARNDNGFCIRCGPGEPGEAISKIADAKSQAGAAFEGYTDTEATAKKVLRDVFEAGDAWYRSGDLMRRDARGFFYFVDRIGDTYRWKGENVSTLQVAEAICACPGVREAAVYGVAVPGADGRAGMAAIVADPALDLAALYRQLAQALPDYARPLFLRLRSAIDVTETFKHRKQELARQGFDPNATADPIYLDDRRNLQFVRVDPALFDRLKAGQVRI